MIGSPGTSYQTRAYILFHFIPPPLVGRDMENISTMLAHQAAPKKTW